MKRIDPARLPGHVAIIMDGNGRWAELRRLPRLEGHRAGAKAIRAVVMAAAEVGVRYLTVYTFSSENWERPDEEVRGLMGLFREMLEAEIDELDSEGVRIRVIGHLEAVPAATREAFADAAEHTASNDRLQLIVALNYGARTEIADAARQLAVEVAAGEIDPGGIGTDDVAARLHAPDVPDPDLLIRTGGNLRVSNFLLWQIAYSEIRVEDKLWPDYGRGDFLAAISDLQRRERRFGRVESAE